MHEDEIESKSWISLNYSLLNYLKGDITRNYTY